ncbi:hypothetical protein TWF506_004397 [Arthrobotrys conoides]|uniref:Uncharacterized protein n=1 Tax=Arthrobotrys conoides TaxID=74498 RepID=A0AAN8RPB1_9PEZI
MDDQTTPLSPKKSLKSYITTLTRKVSKKTVTGAQHLGTLARSTTVSRSKTSKSSRKYNTTTNTTMTMNSVASVFIPSDLNGGGPPQAPRLPNVVYRSPDADFIESQMEAKIRSIGTINEGEQKEDKEGKKEKKDRMGGYTIRIIKPNCNNEA